MAIAERNGAKLFYEDTGSGDPPMLFVHGIGNHEHYARQIEHFARSHRVIAPDLPGFGQSEAPDDREYGISAFAEDVAWLCDELELRRAVIVGHSMAGCIALEVAAARPELVSALVLLDSLPIIPVPMVHEGQAKMARALEGPAYRDAFRGFAENLLFVATDPGDVRDRIIEDMLATPQHVLARTFKSLSEWSGEEIAGRIQAPVLLVQMGDGLQQDVPRLRQLMPRLELGRTVGSGHFGHVVVPEQVNAMIDRFLAVAVETVGAGEGGRR
jgi:pimeloyl-ACP methyl ester carboxylesterase